MDCKVCGSDLGNGAQLSRVLIEGPPTAEARAKNMRALLESEQFFRTLSEASNTGIFITDAEGQCCYTNPKYQQLVGCSFEEALGHGWMEYIHRDDQADALRGWHLGLKAGKPFDLSFRFRLAEGSLRWVHLRAAPFPLSGEKVLAFFGTVTDASAQYQVERALRAANQRLERLVSSRTEFMNMMAHDLRTPLTAMKLGVEILRGTKAEQEKTLAMLQRNVSRMTSLLDDLLLVSRMEHGKVPLRLEPLDLGEVVRESVEVVQPAVASKRVGLEVTLAAPLPVVADAQRLTQVLTNLLSNAAKFTPPGGRIRITGEELPQHVLLRVEDSGRGFTPEESTKLFQAFSQSDRHRVPGTGLGLWICKSILDEHGGSIHAESPGPGKGATFVVTLPKGPLVQVLPA